MNRRLHALATAPEGLGAADHSAFDTLLSRYVRYSDDGVNRLDYGAWRASAQDRKALDDYLNLLQGLQPSSLTRAEQFVFWVNLYNAETLRAVIAHRPVNSILLVRPNLLSIGPWRRKALCVDGVRLSLSDIENRILRPGFGDPRLHYALNCASTGCPVLRTRAWTALNLDEELDAAARALINHPRGVAVKRGRLVLSRIFKWYRKDFGGSDADVIGHLERYADPDLRKRLRESAQIGGYQYDWTINEAQLTRKS